MILNISELLKKKIEVQPFEILFSGDELVRDDFRIILKSPLKISGNATLNGEVVNVTGNVKVLIETQCSRCLEKFDYLLDVDFDEDFSKSHIGEDYYLITSGEIDFTDMVIDNLILAMPLRMLCNDECRGLCPVCGQNLNKGECNCERGTINPKFAVLKDLFKQD